MKTIFLIIFLSLAHNAMSETVLEQKREYYPINQNGCVEKDICDLDFLDFRVQKKKANNFGYEYYMSDMILSYQTKNKSQVTNYTIVQKIKGCQYEAKKNKSTGKISYYRNIARLHFGELIDFIHRDWEIDNTDPTYSYTSLENLGPHSLLQFNCNGKIDPNKSKYYFRDELCTNLVYATDLPGQAYVEIKKNGDIHTRNTSLHLQTCFMKSQDIPDQADPKGSNLDFSKAIKCFDWSHDYRYDFKKNKMVLNPEENIAEICEPMTLINTKKI